MLAEHWDAVAAGEPFASEYRMVGADGTVLWIYDAAVPVVNAAGRMTLHGHCLEILPEGDTVSRGGGEETELESAVAKIPAAVYRCRCDAYGTIEFLSDQIEELVGYPGERLHRQHVCAATTRSFTQMTWTR